MFKSFIEEYRGNDLGVLIENEPLAKHTTFRVGGLPVSLSCRMQRSL